MWRLTQDGDTTHITPYACVSNHRVIGFISGLVQFFIHASGRIYEEKENIDSILIALPLEWSDKVSTALCNINKHKMYTMATNSLQRRHL